MPLSNGSGSWIPILDPDPAIFVIDLQDVSKKLIFQHNFFCLLLFEGTITLFFKDKKSKKSHKIVGFKVFFLLFLHDNRRIREAKKHVDPDPEHCNKCFLMSSLKKPFLWRGGGGKVPVAIHEIGSVR
jgi:hypothetical protein